MQAKVLVVDDDVSLRASIRTILEHQGFAVTVAPNVPEALEILNAESFDVLLSDLQMPGPGDGLTVIRATKALMPATITLLMSGHPHPDAGAVPLASDEILHKPFPMGSLVDLIHRKLQNADEIAATRV